MGQFEGETLGRLTVGADNPLHDSVTQLSPHFDMLNWQFENGAYIQNFPIDEIISQSRKLYEFWFREIEDNGNVLQWYPFTHPNGILLDEGYRERQPHTKENENIRAFLGCGAGLRSFQIENETGNIYACTEMMGNPQAALGSIYDGFTREPVFLGELEATRECVGCDILNVCGGRCHNFFSEQYCRINRERIRWVLSDLPQIMDKIIKGELKKTCFFPADSSYTFVESAV